MPSETRYMRQDLQLLKTNQGSSGYSCDCDYEATCYWGIRVWKKDNGASEEEITSGTPVAIVSRGANGEGLQSNQWTCPETSLATTNRIVVRVYEHCGSEPWVLCATFTTDQSQDWDSPVQLDNVAWTVYYYTKRNWDSKVGTTICSFSLGVAYGSRVENFTWSEAAPPPPEGGILVQIMMLRNQDLKRFERFTSKLEINKAILAACGKLSPPPVAGYGYGDGLVSVQVGR